jgi:hypothetical protein
MPPQDSSFHVDEQSASEAAALTAQLRETHAEVVETADEAMLREFAEREFRGKFTPFAYAIPDRLTVALSDLIEDLNDFGLFATLFRRAGIDMPVTLMGPDKIPLPLVLSPDGLNFPFLSYQRTEPFFSKVSSLLEAEQNVSYRPWKAVQEAFFDGFQPFLATRLAGLRWFGSARPPGVPMAAGGGSGQRWTIDTKSHGLSFYYRGTHMGRVPATHLGGTTTPLVVVIPLGTVWLGADVGPGGKIHWDKRGSIVVPSTKPTYTNMKF